LALAEILTTVKKTPSIRTDIIIIGAGLTSLSIAYFLKNHDKEIKIIEARPRLGGRILTSYQEGQAPIEKGATWLNKNHTVLNQLLKELGIALFKQEIGGIAIYETTPNSPHQIVQLPHNNEPSFRIKNGTSVLVDTLVSFIPAEQIHLGETALSIEDLGNHILVKTNKANYKAKTVISTLPPNLFISSIKTSPSLPENLQNLARKTHTWMGESIKIGLRFKEAFWQKRNTTGTIFSNAGPIPEMYDHSDDKNSNHALKGFLNGEYYAISKKERLELILNQLYKYYGDDIKEFTSYEELIWRNEAFTYAPYSDHILPHQNNGHPLYQQSYFNGKLFIAGAETAPEFPGYMEGAVRSAKLISQQILS